MDKCPHCDYTSNTNTGMNTHILNNHSTKEEKKLKYNYYCEYCDYGSFSKPLYEKHIKSNKHQIVENLVNK